MYIHHVTINTGHVARTSRADVADTTLALLVPWLDRALAAGHAIALPADDLAHFSASAVIDAGALIVTVYAVAEPHVPGRPHAGATIPIVVFAVAGRSRQGVSVWDTLLRLAGKPDAPPPAAPWCVVQLLQPISAVIDATAWLGDFERCIAWAWLTRNPSLAAI